MAVVAFITGIIAIVMILLAPSYFEQKYRTKEMETSSGSNYETEED
jgi:hypothetical protein